MAKTRNERRKEGQKKRAAQRLAMIEAAQGETRAALEDMNKIVGKGKYNLIKAARGKNAARKRANTMKKVVDIGGRSLGALGQAASGDYLGALMSGLKILGKGDYSLQRNTIIQDLTSNQVPVMHSSKESIRFRHREFVMDVLSPPTAGSFNVTTWALNPGLSNLFPFLSNIALNFQEYRFHGLAFEYKSMSGVAVTTGSTMGMGTVCMAAQYRANATTFQNKLEMMNQMWSVDGRPSDSFMLPIECAPLETPLDCLYVRGAAIPDDVKFYDLAKVSLATTGIPVANSLIGELWITYDVELLKPQASGILDLYQPYLFANSSASVTVAAPFPALASPNTYYNNFDIKYLGNSVTGLTVIPGTYGFYHRDSANTFPLLATPFNSGGITSFTISARSIVFPMGLVGAYEMSLGITGTSANTNWPSGVDAYGTTVYGTSSSNTEQNNWKLVRQFNGGTGTQTTIVLNLVFQIVSPSSQCIITLNGGAVFPTSTTVTQWSIRQINANAIVSA